VADNGIVVNGHPLLLLGPIKCRATFNPLADEQHFYVVTFLINFDKKNQTSLPF
jgi:hypothetical protein